MIASYNAGPLPVARWAGINDKGDPLLSIEWIPYWETRYYVPSVMRNMWVYQGLDREDTPTLKAMAEHHWPAFPSGTTRLSRQRSETPSPASRASEAQAIPLAAILASIVSTSSRVDPRTKGLHACRLSFVAGSSGIEEAQRDEVAAGDIGPQRFRQILCMRRGPHGAEMHDGCSGAIGCSLRHQYRRSATVQPEIEIENIDAIVAGQCDVNSNDAAITQCGPSPHRFHCRIDSGLRDGRTPVDPVALVLAFRRNVLIGKAEVANFAVRHHCEVQTRVAVDPEQFFDDDLRAGLKQCFGRLRGRRRFDRS